MNIYDSTDLLKFSYTEFPVILPVSTEETEFYLRDMETRDFFGYLCFYGEAEKEKPLALVSTRFGHFLVNKAARKSPQFDLLSCCLNEEGVRFLENYTAN